MSRIEQLAMEFPPATPAVALPQDCPAEIVGLFERFALELIGTGFARYSARAIIHRIRWHQQVERGDRDFKCNNNWTPGLARWFMKVHPLHDGFFETRESGKDD